MILKKGNKSILMKTTIRYILFLTIIIVSTSFVHKDLHEYGKWLKFYNLNDEDFQQKGSEKKIDPSWKEYDLSNEGKKLYESLYFYSSDSTYFLDLYSYSIILDQDSKGVLTWGGGDPESSVQLVKTKGLSASTLLFFGTDEYAETAIWRNKYLFEICGFKIENDIYTPTLWKFDLSKMTSIEFESKKTFKSRPKSYLIEVRLGAIKMK
jgi:hypothetical protein